MTGTAGGWRHGIAVAALAVTALSGCSAGSDPSGTETAAVPTSVTGGRTVCGVVPARAITLAVGTSSWKVQSGAPTLSTSNAQPQACFVNSAGSSPKRLLIVDKATQARPGDVKADIDQQIADGAKRLPGDIAGEGYLNEEAAHDVQTRLLVGDVEIQIHLLKGGPHRDSRADALALTRLLVPRLT